MLRNPATSGGRALALAISAAALAACGQASGETASSAVNRTAYGERVAIGEGTVRTYVTYANGVATEVGVAMTEGALSGLARRAQILKSAC